jgi:hypothetical protein
MARGSWLGLYNDVIDGLMLQRREQELLLLMAIAKYCDPFGFCFPGRVNLMRIRRISQPVYERRLTFLEDHSYVTVTETYDYRRRQTQFDFQVNPRVLYVREEIQEYCEHVFDAVQERDFAFEKSFLEILFRTNESQPEVVPESETESEPASATRRRTRKNNQLSAAPTQQGRNASTMRNQAEPKQRNAPQQRQQAQTSKEHPQAGGADEFTALMADDVDDDRIVQEIIHVVSTTKHQAAAAVETYPREGIVHWLEITARRREKGTLDKPGGFFFKMLQKHVAPIEIPEPQNNQTGDWF